MIHVASLLHDDVIDNAGVSWRSSQYKLAQYAEHILAGVGTRRRGIEPVGIAA